MEWIFQNHRSIQKNFFHFVRSQIHKLQSKIKMKLVKKSPCLKLALCKRKLRASANMVRSTSARAGKSPVAHARNSASASANGVKRETTPASAQQCKSAVGRTQRD